MISLQTLLRRTAATAGAIAALMVMGPATSQTVTLSGATGNSCTYSQMTVTPAGNFTVTCGTSTSPGTFSVVAPTQLATNASSASSSATAVSVRRSNGSSGEVLVNFSVATSTASCTPDSGTLTFGEGITSQPIVVQATSATGSCTVSITSPAGTTGSPTTRTINIVDPEANVTFAFTGSSPAAARVGTSPTVLVVSRTGGTANEWTVPYILSGTLAPGGTLLAGTLSPSTLTFPANSSSANLTFTPPAITPATPPLPAGFTVTLGPPAKTATASTQQGLLGTPSSFAVNMTGPVVGCPAETVAGSLGSAGFVNDVRLTSGTEIGTFALPTLAGVSTMANIGLFYTAQSTPNMDNGGFFSIEMHINKCKGLVQASTTNKCYGVLTNPVGGEIKWIKTLSAKYSTEAIANAAGFCYAPAAEGPWYFNLRYNYPQGCKGTTKCGWQVVWRPLN